MGVERLYDTILECIDWRYSAAIVGLIKYFNFSNDMYEKIQYEQGEEFISFHQEDIFMERYLAFVEEYYKEDMFHKKVEEQLFYSKFDEDAIKQINEWLRGNKVMQDVFGKLKFDGTNKDTILKTIENNRQIIVQETFRYKKYVNFCHKTLLGEEEQPHCRLVGYNVDEGRKSKSTAYLFQNNLFVGKDRLEFDFIPFAFTNTYDAFFINNNMNIETLYHTNQHIQRKIKEEHTQDNVMEVLFEEMMVSAEFLDYDVEVIVKSRNKKFFESLYIRKSAIDKLKKLENLKGISFSIKVTEDYYLPIGSEVIHCILNDLKVDSLIYFLLKEEEKKKGGEFSYQFAIQKLITVNQIIKEEAAMTEQMKGAYKSAISCTEKLTSQNKENKIKSYKQKLISAIVVEDYDRVNVVLLQLSEYSETPFPFLYDLFEDFEQNKEIALTFINTLGYKGKEEMGGKIYE